MENIPFIRFNHLGKEKTIITNIYGDSIVLKNNDFTKYIKGDLEKKSELYGELEDKLLLNNDNYEKKAVEEYTKRFGINFIGPTLHIIVITKGCNHQCKYCHAAADYRYEDESMHIKKEDAKKTIDIIYQSPAQYLNIEFQGGEPLVNIDLIDYIIKYSEEKNIIEKKDITYSLVSNLTLIDENLLDKLFSYPNLQISTSLDGDKKTHDFNRLLIGKANTNSSYNVLKEKIELIRKREKIEGKKLLTGAMGVITKVTLDRYKELVDSYIDLGFDSIFLKKLNPLGFAKNKEDTLSYKTNELLDFHIKYYDYLIELHKKGIFIRDGFLSICLKKIITPDKINYMDLRTPCGAGIGQIAYDYTGKIYTCDEGRMVDDDTFQIGTTDSSLEDLVQNETVGAMMDASSVESLPCDICAYAPFCGVCPIESYEARGNIYTNQIFDNHCKFFTFIYDRIFEILSEKEGEKYDFLMKHK